MGLIGFNKYLRFVWFLGILRSLSLNWHLPISHSFIDFSLRAAMHLRGPELGDYSTFPKGPKRSNTSLYKETRSSQYVSTWTLKVMITSKRCQAPGVSSGRETMKNLMTEAKDLGDRANVRGLAAARAPTEIALSWIAVKEVKLP